MRAVLTTPAPFTQISHCSQFRFHRSSQTSATYLPRHTKRRCWESLRQHLRDYNVYIVGLNLTEKQRKLEAKFRKMSASLCGPGSSVGIATNYGLDGPGIESRWGARISALAQTGPMVHSASGTMGTVSFPGVKSGRGVRLTPHPLLVPWSRKTRAIPLLPLLARTACTEPQCLYEGALYLYLLTPWCRVLLEKLTGLQLVKKFPAFHGTKRFITALTSVRHLSLSWASPNQSIYPHPTSWRSVLILSTHLRLYFYLVI